MEKGGTRPIRQGTLNAFSDRHWNNSTIARYTDSLCAVSPDCQIFLARASSRRRSHESIGIESGGRAAADTNSVRVTLTTHWTCTRRRPTMYRFCSAVCCDVKIFQLAPTRRSHAILFNIAMTTRTTIHRHRYCVAISIFTHRHTHAPHTCKFDPTVLT